MKTLILLFALVVGGVAINTAKDLMNQATRVVLQAGTVPRG